MGNLAKIGKYIIRINADHLPPHFHVFGPDADALIVIETLEVYAGTINADLLADVRSWAKANRDRLVSEWNAWNPRFPIR